MKNLTYYLKKMRNWLLPFTCIFCSAPSGREQDLCEACFNDIPRLQHACQRCANPLQTYTPNLLCGACLKKAPPFQRTFALYFYKDLAVRLIMDLKFGEALLNARILGELLADTIQNEWYKNSPLPEALIPIPLHPKRLKERGFNQALEIAKPISKLLKIPLNYIACQRVKHTEAQATLPAKERYKNIKNAFQVNLLPYRYVAVLDDVITTGQTMNEFCQSLKRAGVQKIDVWCCARPISIR